MPESPSLRWPRLAVVLSLLIAAGMTYYHLGLFRPHESEALAATGLGRGYPFGNDFYPIWLTSREAMLSHRNPYSPEMTQQIQTGLFGRVLGRGPADPPPDYRQFAYPAYVDLLFWPLAVLPFPAVRIALAFIFAGLTAASIPLWLRALKIRAGPLLLAIVILFTLSSYAVLEGLFAVQVGLLVGFLIAASLSALAARRFFLAGSLFAFTIVKPQVSALVAIYLLLWSFCRWRERRGFACGFFAWSAFFGGSSLIVWPHWIPQWLHVLSEYGSYARPPLITYSIGRRFGPGFGPFLIAGLLSAALILMWRMRNVSPTSPPFMLTVSLLLALTSITLLPGQAVYDHVVLIPGILLTAWTWRLVAASSRAFAVVVGLGALALFWQWMTAIPLIFVRPFISPAEFFSNRVLLLPFGAAASVPLAVTAVLGFMMWKGMREDPVAGEKNMPVEMR
jgi:hypothetical protein